MSARPLDASEREQLCDQFLELGSEAPTLCEGWCTLDLAAHLVVREHDPRAGLAILGGDRFAGLARRLMDGARQRGFEPLVERLRGGPPLVPWRLPGLRTLLNLNEWFVHHEDARRANGRDPRSDVPELEAALWRMVRLSGRFMVRGLKGAGLELAAPDHGTVVVRDGQPLATLRGGPQELVLYLNGRRTAARVEILGDQPALDALAAARLGV
jgi:uncharacterized protein (TIGR03085 family)